MTFKRTLSVVAATVAVAPAFGASFVNGGFEAGDTSGWTVTSGYRGNILNSALSPASFSTNAVPAHSSIISSGTVDPNVGAALGSTVYSGSSSYRVEDTVNGGYASVISQTVANYTDSNIFFAWKAVLEGAHGVDDAATIQITLHDDTANSTVISRIYNAANGGGGVDARFTLSANNFFYTADWQIEQLAIDSALSGHTFTLSVLAADCQPTGHTGYVYLDGFGAVTPPVNDVPEPASLALVGVGLAGLFATRRRRAAPAA